MASVVLKLGILVVVISSSSVASSRFSPDVSPIGAELDVFAERLEHLPRGAHVTGIEHLYRVTDKSAVSHDKRNLSMGFELRTSSSACADCSFQIALFFVRITISYKL